MPAGGASAGGSQQTGFEMELITAQAASRMFQGWPNRESSSAVRKAQLGAPLNGRPGREAVTPGEAGRLGIESGQADRNGAGEGLPHGSPPGRPALYGELGDACGPDDVALALSVRLPLILWTEEDAVILPPDDLEGTPFYLDPPGQPGQHRDLFKTWGRRVAAELVVQGYPMSQSVISHLPVEYQSDSEESEQAVTPRSVSPPLDQIMDSSVQQRGKREHI